MSGREVVRTDGFGCGGCPRYQKITIFERSKLREFFVCKHESRIQRGRMSQGFETFTAEYPVVYNPKERRYDCPLERECRLNGDGIKIKIT